MTELEQKERLISISPIRYGGCSNKWELRCKWDCIGVDYERGSAEHRKYVQMFESLEYKTRAKGVV